MLHLLGPPGTGKSHLAVALGIAAVKARKSVYRTTLAELVEALAKARREDRLADKLRFFTRTSLLIVDEIGYVTIDGGGANLFFQLVNARYEKGAMILTSNRGFAEWGELFGDPVVATALLDRLLHPPSSSTSKAPATGCANTPTSSPNTSAPTRPSRRPLRPDDAADRPGTTTRTPMSDGELNHRTGEFYFGTFGEFSIGIDTVSRPPMRQTVGV